MSNKVKDITIKSQTYYFFNDIIDIESFDSNNIKIDEKSYKNILIYYIEYVAVKEYVKIYSVNPLYLIFRYVNRGGCRGLPLLPMQHPEIADINFQS